MCGIAGIVGPGVGTPADRAHLAQMLDRMVHRGPDDGHVVAVPGALLGARRLAIVGGPDGRQPMLDPRGPVVVALNGELYGHAVLHRDLEARGERFATATDTEVLLRHVVLDGAACLPRLDGMFAFAAWDGRTRTLLLARDRLGEKPLVWFTAGDRLVFASELSALTAHPAAPRALDPDAIARYLVHRFVPAPRTPFADVHRLPPAHVLVARDGRVDVTPWWTLPAPGDARPVGGRTAREAAATVRDLLANAVASRRRADVPVGVWLSGGLDSAALAAFARRDGPVPTFTLRPTDADFDEGDAARATARALGTDHHEVPMDAAALAAGFDEVFARVDEPIGDPSLVPTLLLARASRAHVKVVLSGEGADELFGGYPTYVGARLAGWARLVPGPLRRRFARRGAAGHGNARLGWLLRRFLDGAGRAPLARHLAWFGAFGVEDLPALFRREALPASAAAACSAAYEAAAAPAAGTGDPLDALLRMDLLLHLPDALLAKVDRASMLVGLEARAPFLEPTLVEMATRLPAARKVGRFTTKRVLRRALEGIVPPEVLTRRKRGFAVPVARALAGRLGDRLRDRLTSSSPTMSLLDPSLPLALLAEHRSGTADHARLLYPLLALLEWGSHGTERAQGLEPSTFRLGSGRATT